MICFKFLHTCTIFYLANICPSLSWKQKILTHVYPAVCLIQHGCTSMPWQGSRPIDAELWVSWGRLWSRRWRHGQGQRLGFISGDYLAPDAEHPSSIHFVTRYNSIRDETCNRMRTDIFGSLYILQFARWYFVDVERGSETRRHWRGDVYKFMYVFIEGGSFVYWPCDACFPKSGKN